MYFMEIITSRVLYLWMIFIIISMGLLYNIMDNTMHMFFRVGPNDNLYVIGIYIDNYQRYSCVLCYCFINSVMRCVTVNILQPWLINQVQDTTKEKHSTITLTAYQINTAIKLYTWIDWYIYMNLLFSQMDILIIEVGADIIVSNIAVYYYLHNKSGTINEKNLIMDSV